MTIALADLFIYPVKSLRGIALKTALATPQGLALDIGAHRVFDRQWMVIKPNGRFVTQRQVPAMALISTELAENGLILHKTGMPDCLVPYSDTDTIPKPTITSAKIWQDNCEVQETAAHIGQWLTLALQSPEPLRLVKLAPETQRIQSKPELLGADTRTHFADAAPYLITNTASLEAVNNKLQAEGEDSVTMEHFRPNIVISGLPAFAEHQIADITLSQPSLSNFRLCYPCQRCVMVTINPETAIKNPKQQPFMLLAAMNPMPDNPKAPAFGVNATLASGQNLLQLSAAACR